VNLEEECDLGLAFNDDRYGGCAYDCKLGPRCGDGIVNGDEECDLGPQNVTWYGADVAGCTPGCRKPHFCGDGIADIEHGEQCDLGDLNGGFEQRCGVDCQIVDTPCVIYCL
jgi:hypothetical protein